MTDLAHPSLDELADLREGLLPRERSDVLGAHLTTCQECSAVLASLEAVETTLAEIGSATQRMPDAVSASLDDALRAAAVERAAGVPSLAERRASSERAKTKASGGSRWTLAAGAAAATVVLGFTAADLLQRDGATDSDNAATSDAAGVSGGRTLAQDSSHSAAGSPSASSPTVPSTTATDQRLPRVRAGTIADYARTVTSSPSSAYRTQQQCRSVRPTGGARVADVRWHRALAVLVVDPTARRATVYTCEVDPSLLFSTSY